MLIVLLIILVIVALFCAMAITGAPYVPSLKKELRELPKLYKFSKKDLVVDLGSGDGVVLRELNKLGAKGFGVELNPILSTLSKWRFRKNPDITIKTGNLFTVDFPAETTVVYMFSDMRDVKKMLNMVRKQAKKIGHPLYVISFGFEIPDEKLIKNHRAFFLYKIH